MAIQIIRTWGDPVLQSVAKPIPAITLDVVKLLDDLADTLYHHGNGIGLAAPQIGVSMRAAVIDLRDGTGKIELINPEIVYEEGEQRVVDGCLSIPGVYYQTLRPYRVVVKALNRSGEEFEVDGTGLLAHCLAHEIDHLNGVLFTDHAQELQSKDIEMLFSQL